MSIFVYKCQTCNRVEERTDVKIADRYNGYDCNAKILKKETHKMGHHHTVHAESTCPGKMEFQPIQKTSFYFKGGV